MSVDAEKVESWGAEEMDLFQAAREESPSADSRAGLYGALGLTPPAPGGGEPQGSELSNQGATLEVGARSGIFAKPLARLAAGVGVLALSVPAYLAVQSSGGDSEAAAVEKVVEPHAEIRTAMPASAGPAAAAAPEHELVQAEEPTDAARSIDELPEEQSVAPRRAEKKAERPSLKEELALLQRARAALGSSNISQCEALLQEHRTRFVPPRLASEARVLRVESLVAQGRIGEAKSLAAPLLKADSPYRARMETLLSQ